MTIFSTEQLGSSKFLAGIVVFASTAVLAFPAAANQWDDIPEFEESDHLAMKRSLDGPRYDSLRDCYEDFDSLVGAEYFGTIVSVTEPEGSLSRDHDNADEWADREHIDPESDVVIVLGAANHAIGIDVGDRWRRRGLDREALVDIIDSSHVPSQMSRYNFDDAMCLTATAIDYGLASLEVEHAAKALLNELDDAYLTAVDGLEQIPPLQERTSDLTTEAREALESTEAASSRANNCSKTSTGPENNGPMLLPLSLLQSRHQCLPNPLQTDGSR